jgi:hypothetical protein
MKIPQQRRKRRECHGSGSVPHPPRLSFVFGGAGSNARRRDREAQLVAYYASESGSVRPASPPHHGKAGKARGEQCNGSWFGYQFGDHDLAVAGLEIGKQDLVGTHIEGAAATAGAFSARRANATCPAAVTATATGTEASASAATEATSSATPGEIWKRPTASATPKGVAACGEKSATATAGAHGDDAAAITIGSARRKANGTTAVRAGESTAARQAVVAYVGTAPSTTTGDNQRRVPWADHERTAAATTPGARFVASRTADSYLQALSCGQAEVAADLGALTAGTDDTHKGTTTPPALQRR